jgi:hypothetical protein
VTAVERKVVLRSGQNKFAVIDWDGNLAQEYNNAATAFAGTNLVTCLGTMAVAQNTTTKALYGISTADFSVEQTGTNTNSYWNLANNSTTGLIAAQSLIDIATFDQVDDKFTSALASDGTTAVITFETGSNVEKFTSGSEYIGINGTLYVDNGGGAGGDPAFLSINPSTGVVTTVTWQSELIDATASRTDLYLCGNTTQLLRARDLDDPTIEITDHSGNTLATLVLFVIGDYSAYTYIGAACDSSEAMVLVKNNNTGALKAYNINLSTYAVTDISATLLSGLTEADMLSYTNQSRMCAIGLTY